MGGREESVAGDLAGSRSRALFLRNKDEHRLLGHCVLQALNEFMFA